MQSGSSCLRRASVFRGVYGVCAKFFTDIGKASTSHPKPVPFDAFHLFQPLDSTSNLISISKGEFGGFYTCT